MEATKEDPPDGQDPQEKPQSDVRRCRCGYPLNVCWRCSSPDDWRKEEP